MDPLFPAEKRIVMAAVGEAPADSVAAAVETGTDIVIGVGVDGTVVVEVALTVEIPVILPESVIGETAAVAAAAAALVLIVEILAILRGSVIGGTVTAVVTVVLIVAILAILRRSAVGETVAVAVVAVVLIVEILATLRGSAAGETVAVVVLAVVVLTVEILVI